MADPSDWCPRSGQGNGNRNSGPGDWHSSQYRDVGPLEGQHGSYSRPESLCSASARQGRLSRVP